MERTHDIEVAVVALPAGSDPDEMARTDPDALRAAVEQADTVPGVPGGEGPCRRQDGVPCRGRHERPEAALAVVAEHPDPLVRDQYVMTVADRCRIDSAALRDRLEKVLRSPRPDPASNEVRREAGRKPARGEGQGWSGDEPLPQEPPEWGDERGPFYVVSLQGAPNLSAMAWRPRR